MMAVSYIEGGFQEYQKKVTVELLELEKVVEDADVKRLIQSLGNTTLDEAVTHLRVLQNAIAHHVRERNKILRVKDLGITLLE